MDISTLKRDPKVIHQDWKTVGDQRIITQKGCKIYIPSKYQDNRLVVIGVETYILGIFAVVIGDRYGVSRAPAMLRVEPDNIATVKIEDEDYLELTFEPGSSVISNTDVVQNNSLLYTIYNEFIAKGYIPWYFTYQDLGELFSLSKYYTGTFLGANHVIPELIAATISRNPDNLKQQYRHVVEKPQDLDKVPPHIVKLNSVTYGATNTTAKLIGAYWEEGVTSALVHPSAKHEDIEDILRK